MNIFGGLEIGKRSIMTQQSALNVTGHNIANVNTPGYSRQSANMVTSTPWHTPMLTGNTKVGQFGTGVDVASIDRLRDRFLDEQIRHENRTCGYWVSMQENLARIEVILNEPSQNGLRGVMDQFWESWQDLSAHPESEAVRSVVVQRGMAMSEAFNHTHRQLKELREDVNAGVAVKVDEINSIAQQICDLNKQILSISVAGKEPNDLLDKRDLLLDQLSQIVNINVYEQKNAVDESTGTVKRFSGMITVQLGGRSLIQGAEYNKLDTREDSQGMHMVVWADTKTKASIEGGELRGLLDIRGRTEYESEPSAYKEIIPNMLDDLNKLAKTIVIQTNKLHRSGYSLNNDSIYPDGSNFFQQPLNLDDDTLNWAEYMQLSGVIVNDPKNIAAASQPTWVIEAGNPDPIKGNFGDGSIALKIAQLKHNLNDSGWWNIDADEVDLTANSFTYRISIDDGTNFIDIEVQNPANDPIKNMYDLGLAVQKAIDEKPDLEGKIMVRCSGNKLTFYSNSSFILEKTVDGTIQNVEAVEGGNMLKHVTSDDFWRSICADLGVISQEATRMAENQDRLLGQLDNKRQSLSGVSLDEELTNLIRFQHAYNAASRFITTIDEQIDVIVNRMGLVGR
ncbi:MAG TPA: flagellar hook-associated protein FlgK [Syntrophomonadaceae bacterium]|nr:flagellar hook-associated protein FlgK [Syntrophomonadaceae bacterium]